jgi:hypothetical protein
MDGWEKFQFLLIQILIFHKILKGININNGKDLLVDRKNQIKHLVSMILILLDQKLEEVVEIALESYRYS